MPSPRTVAINAAIVGERPTGLGVFALNVIETLAELGERLVVYTSRPEAVTTAGVDRRRIPAAVRPERGARGHLARLVWAQTGLRARVRHDRPAVLLSLAPDGLFFPGVPQVATVHDLLPLHYAREYPRQRHYFRHYVPAVLRHCRAVITLSEAARQDILDRYRVPADMVFVAPCGYDARRFAPTGHAALGDEPYVLYVGNIMPHKNLLRLMDALADVSALDPVRVVIRGWGRPPHVAALRARIEARGLGARVDWQRYAPADELPALYRGARMLLLPSLREGFGLTALEAMACGTPVVAANTSSLPEVVGDAGILVDPLDVPALAGAIRRVLGDDALAKELRERGLVRARQFSWRRTGEAVQRALGAALGAAA